MVPLDEGIRDCGVWITTSVTAEVHLGLGTWCKRNGGTRFCGDSCTKSEAAERRTTETRRRKSSTRCFLRPGTLVSRNERSRCTKCTAASSIYYAFFGAASSKAKPTPSGSASQVRQRLAGPAAPSSGPLTPAEPTRPAAPSPHRRSLLIGASYAYIGRLGMRTVKVVPLPGMLST